MATLDFADLLCEVKFATGTGVREQAGATCTNNAPQVPPEFSNRRGVVVPPLLGFAVFLDRLTVQQIFPASAILESGFAVQQPLHDVANEGIHRPGLV